MRIARWKHKATSAQLARPMAAPCAGKELPTRGNRPVRAIGSRQEWDYPAQKRIQ